MEDNMDLYRMLLLLLCLQLELVDSVQPGCHCFAFRSSELRKSGIFKSPQFPTPYPMELQCLIFVFTAQPDEIVRLKFKEFDMKPTINNRCHDYVRLYLDSSVAELSSEDLPNYQVCGSQLPQAEFYSSTPILMLEMRAKMSWPYQTPTTVNRFRGFSGSFSFEKTAQYQSGGRALPGSPCDREFRSSDASTGKSGQFFSPRHPQNYRPGDQCRYYFRVSDGERIRLDLRRVSLEGAGGRNATACGLSNPSRKDHLLVYQTESEFGKDSAVLAHYSSFCGGISGSGIGPNGVVSVVSPEAFLLVKFVANGDSVTGAGFVGRYAFVSRHKLTPTAPLERGQVLVDELGRVGTGNGESHPPAVSPALPTKLLSHEFVSSRAKQGSFSSENFPAVYPQRMRVEYRFLGEPGESLRISFETFQLEALAHGETCGPDYRGDRLDIHDGADKIDSIDLGALSSPSSSASSSSSSPPNFIVRCGVVRAPDDIWSVSGRVSMLFHSNGVATPGERGFSGSYQFFRRQQQQQQNQQPGPPSTTSPTEIAPPPPLKCPEKPLLIESRQSAFGIVRTPGFPFGYPGGTCRWILVGQANQTERVVLEIRRLATAVPKTDNSQRRQRQPISVRCANQDKVVVTRYVVDDRAGGAGAGLMDESVEETHCNVLPERPVRVMSGGGSADGRSRPRLRVEFQAEQSVVAQAQMGLEFAYKFVQDFAVLGTYKNQRLDLGCHFSFYSRQHSTGSFSSPNFPFEYPERLHCQYFFYARPRERIRIEFSDFSTETLSDSCTDSDSDFVHVEECDRPGMPALARLCGDPSTRGRRFRVEQQAACLRLVFVSNSRYSATGFFANYFFEKYSSVHLSHLAGEEGDPNSSPLLSFPSSGGAAVQLGLTAISVGISRHLLNHL